MDAALHLTMHSPCKEHPPAVQGRHPSLNHRPTIKKRTIPTLQISELSAKVDALYAGVFVGIALPPPDEGEEGAAAELAAQLAAAMPDPAALDEARFGELGRTAPKVGRLRVLMLLVWRCCCGLLPPLQLAVLLALPCCAQPPLHPPHLPSFLQLLAALIRSKERADSSAWTAFQAQLSNLKLQRSRLEGECADLAAALEAAAARQRLAGQSSEYEAAVGAWDGAQQAGGAAQGQQAGGGQAQGMKVVLVTGFESFNVDLYKKAAVALARACPGISLRVFSDRDLGERAGTLLRRAGVCMGGRLLCEELACAAGGVLRWSAPAQPGMAHGSRLAPPPCEQARAVLRWRRPCRAPTSSLAPCSSTLIRQGRGGQGQAGLSRTHLGRVGRGS